MAIAYQNSDKFTSNNGSFDVGNGANRVLFVFAKSLADTVTNITYDSVALTKITATTYPGTGRSGLAVWYLVAPTANTNTITLTGVFEDYIAISYRFAKQTGVPDSSHVDTASSVDTITGTTTSVLDNCWTLIGETSSGTDTQTAGTGTTQRQKDDSRSWFVGDSNGPIYPAGSTSLVVDFSGTVTAITSIIVSFAEVPPADISETEEVTVSETTQTGPGTSETETITLSDTNTKTGYGWVNEDKSSAPTWVNEDKS